MSFPLKRVAAAMLAALTIAGPAQAQESKPLRLLLPYVQGNGLDVISRQVAEQMSPLLKQPVVVLNVPGGNGVSAVLDLMNQPADGSTILGIDAGQWAIAPALKPDLPYVVQRDFAPLGIIFTNPLFLSVPSTIPAANLQEFLSYARARPGQLNYGSVGVGSLFHLVTASLAANAKLNMNHIPYKGGTKAMLALARGDLSLLVTSLAVARPHLQTGKVKLLAVTTKTRSKQLPEMPTVTELTGFADFDFAGILGFVARSGTTKATIDRLSQAIMKGASNPDIAARAAQGGFEMTPGTPEQMADMIRGDTRRYTEVVKLSGAAAN